jgi:FixJ family two-component response regulator
VSLLAVGARYRAADIGYHEGMAGERPVLLVDDDALLREALRLMLLQSLDCQVVAFGDGATALAYTEHTPPGLALLDVDMLPMSGLELARQLRERFEGLPIMFLTGSNHLDLAAEFAAVGAVANLRKPVRAAELVAAIQAHRIREG